MLQAILTAMKRIGLMFLDSLRSWVDENSLAL